MCCSLRPGPTRVLLLAIVLLACVLETRSAHAQLRVVSYNVAGLNGSQAALSDVIAGLNNDDKPGFATAPHVYVFQEVQSSDLAELATMLTELSPAGVTYAQGTYTNDGEDCCSGAQAMFYRSDTLVETSPHVDIFTGAGRDADRWRLRLVDYVSSDAEFYIYSAHLKASTGQSNEDLRHDGAIAIRNDADDLVSSAHIIYAGDFNVYGNDELAYLEFLSSGNGQAIDPLGSGAWGGSGNAIKHSQSPRTSGGGLAGGGMDDRFDFQLPSSEFHDGEGLSIIAGTYRSLGNDGQHFDQSINNGNNTYYPSQISRSNALADDLHDASDHIPVVVEYQIPAVASASLIEDVGRLIQFAPYAVPVFIENVADVTAAIGADELDYVATSVGALSGSDAGSVTALGPPDIAVFTVDTSVIGAIGGAVFVDSTSQAAANDSIVLPLGGTVVRSSVPSFSATEEMTERAIVWNVEADTGVQTFDVDVYNFGYDSDQALLDVDDVQSVSGSVAFQSGLQSGLGAAAAPLTFSFDTSGLVPGTYDAEMLVETSDEDLPGAAVSFLSATFSIEIGGTSCATDLDGDGMTGFTDLVLILTGWGTNGPGADLAVPLDSVEFGDLVTLLSLWGDCP